MAKRAMMIGLDGADPFVVKKMLDQGRLPNFKKVLEEGTAHKSWTMIGALPSVTPPNWASLATGNWPRTHGITCYHNHTIGKNYDIAEMNWDSRRVMSEMIWEAFGRQGKRSIMMNYCEAWPPRNKDDMGIYVDGTGVIPFMRCSVDYQKIVWLEKGDFQIEERPHTVKKSSDDCVVQGDQYKELAKNAERNDSEFEPMVDAPAGIYAGDLAEGAPKDDEADVIRTPLKAPENWEHKFAEDALVAVVPLNGGLVRRYFVLENNEITIFANRKKDTTPLGKVKVGEWSGWIYDKYTHEDNQVTVAYKVCWIKSESTEDKIKLYVSSALNMDDVSYFYPQEVGRKIYDEVGPILPFAKFGQTKDGNQEGHDILLESLAENMQWQIDATNLLFEMYPDWSLYYVHLHGVDLYNHWYINRTLPGKDENYKLMEEYLFRMYELCDHYIGEMLKHLDGETAVFICSDHAALPRSLGDEMPCMASIAGVTTGVMEELGYTKTYKDEDGNVKIDFSQTKAVFHRSSFIYINLKGRDPQGIVEPEDYDKLVDQIIADMYNYRHPDTGKRVVAFCMTRNEMEIVGMGGPHCGDILVQLKPDYNFEHACSPTTTEHEGYSMNNLCMMIGAGFKKGVTFNRVIRITDVVPTICHLTHTDIPYNVEGGVIWQALEGYDEKVYE